MGPVGSGLRGAGLAQLGGGRAQLGYLGISEAHAGVLPAALQDRDSIELGCGTGYVSAWLARRGARPVGLDNSAAQLATARRLQDRFGLRFPLNQASAEQAPFADASFDLAISEYGAGIWCDPYTWILEAARLLRPGGQLIFLMTSALLMLAAADADDQPAAERLLRPYFGLYRFEWPDDESVTFHLGYGDMIRLLRGCGLEVEDLLELRPEPDAAIRHPFVTLEWARKWPCEEVWKARKSSMTSVDRLIRPRHIISTAFPRACPATGRMSPGRRWYSGCLPSSACSPGPYSHAAAAPRGALLYPRLSREGLEGRFLGLMAYLEGKPEGNNSMVRREAPHRIPCLAGRNLEGYSWV